MILNIKHLNGKTHIIDISLYNLVSILDLKKYLNTIISEAKIEKQRLLFCGRELKNSEIIENIPNLSNSTCLSLICMKDDNKVNIHKTQRKIIEELQIKVLSLEDRIDKLENKKIPEVKNEKLEENISNDEDFKQWVPNMLCNLDSREGRNNLKYKLVKYNNNGEFSIRYEYRT